MCPPLFTTEKYLFTVSIAWVGSPKTRIGMSGMLGDASPYKQIVTAFIWQQQKGSKPPPSPCGVSPWPQSIFWSPCGRLWHNCLIYLWIVLYRHLKLNWSRGAWNLFGCSPREGLGREDNSEQVFWPVHTPRIHKRQVGVGGEPGVWGWLFPPWTERKVSWETQLKVPVKVSWETQLKVSVKVSWETQLKGPVKVSWETQLKGPVKVSWETQLKGPVKVSWETQLKVSVKVSWETQLKVSVKVSWETQLKVSVKVSWETQLKVSVKVSWETQLKGPVKVSWETQLKVPVKVSSAQLKLYPLWNILNPNYSWILRRSWGSPSGLISVSCS